MIYLPKHKEILRIEFEAFLKREIKNAEIVYAAMHSELPAKLFEEVASKLEEIFRSYSIEYLLKYGQEHRLTFDQLQKMIKL